MRFALAPMSAAVVAVCLLFGIGVGGCSTVRVTVDYSPTEDFSTYRTFTWLPSPARPSGDYRLDNPLVDERIRRAVDTGLAAKGYQKRQDRDTDFYVAYHLEIEEKMDVYTVNRGYVNYWGYAVSVPETRVSQYEEGTLVIDVIDARDKELVWRGIGQGRVRRQPTPQQTTQAVDSAVAEILAKFPPDPGKS